MTPRIHHIQLAIPAGGEDRARAFYGTLRGFTEIDKPENLRARGGVWFQTGNLQLHLGVDLLFTPATSAHVAFDVDDLADARARCESAGHPATDNQPLPGSDRIYVDDPFGNRTELLQPI